MVAESVKVEPLSPVQVSVYIVFWLTALVAPEPFKEVPVSMLTLPLGLPAREHDAVSVVHQYNVAVFPFRTVVECSQLGDAAVLKQPVGGGVAVVNVAVTVLGAVSAGTLHGLLEPEQRPPDQTKVEPPVALAFRDPEFPSIMVYVQVPELQLTGTPPTVPVIEPPPVPYL